MQHYGKGDTLVFKVHGYLERQGKVVGKPHQIGGITFFPVRDVDGCHYEVARHEILRKVEDAKEKSDA